MVRNKAVYLALGIRAEAGRKESSLIFPLLPCRLTYK